MLAYAFVRGMYNKCVAMNNFLKVVIAITVAINIMFLFAENSVQASDVAVNNDFNLNSTGSSITSIPGWIIQENSGAGSGSAVVVESPSYNDKSLKISKSNISGTSSIVRSFNPLVGELTIALKLKYESGSGNALYVYSSNGRVLFNLNYTGNILRSLTSRDGSNEQEV